MTNEHSSRSLQLNISWKIISLLLLVVIVVMLGLWKPRDSTDSTRSISVTGEATVSAEPDELVFSPYFEVETSEALTTKAADVTAKLKELGVEDKSIKTNASSYDKYYPMLIEEAGQSNLTLQFTVTLTSNKDLSQKVQDYLVSQNPKGQITPQASFSDDKLKQLEEEASTKATADAKARAEKIARELGARVGKVKGVSEVSGFGVYPLTEEGRDVATSSQASLPVQVGENDFTYQLQVEFELR